MIQCSSQDVTAFPDWVRSSLSCDIKGTELKAEGRIKGRRQKAEGRRQKAEGRRQKAELKAEGRRQKRPIDKLFILLRTGFALHPSPFILHPFCCPSLASKTLYRGQCPESLRGIYVENLS